MRLQWIVCTAVAPLASANRFHPILHDAGDNSDLSIWPFNNHDGDVKEGLSFERTETSFSPVDAGEGNASWWRRQSSGLSDLLEYLFKTSAAAFLPAGLLIASSQTTPRATFDEGHCLTHDAFGGNSCHYDWNEEIAINYQYGQQLDTDDYIEMDVRIDNLIHHKQTCPICGDEPCAVSLVPELHWTITLPPCPLTEDQLVGEWKAKLPKSNPIPSLLNGGSGTVVEGTVRLRKSRVDNNEDDVLMEVKGIVHLK